MTQNKIYLTIMAVVFVGFVVVFTTFQRSTYSELEKRELATFPRFSFDRLWQGQYTDSINTWFSDTEPYRDWFMELSMNEKLWLSLKVGGDEAVTFHASTEADPEMDAELAMEMEDFDPDDIENYENRQTANDKAKVSNHGIIIVGTGDKVRALMAYGGVKGGDGYAETANTYKKAFPSVNVYCMVVPSAAAFYTPEKAKGFTRDQLSTIKNIFEHLDSNVKAVDVYTPLGQHADEDIYLRTDHHWSPLGAYYAAQKFAEVAGVPFRDLKSYDRHVVHGYVGSMYGYSQDISLKRAPEDFVFYKPKNIQYSTTYIKYTVNANYQVTAESAPREGEFFYSYKDGSGGAYCTFMGGDTKLTVVRTGTKNNRRLIILKDSYGNALPGYLFYSFQEIHVIDARYFTKNMRNYVRDNHITDILFANNIFKAFGKTYKAYLRFLDMSDGVHYTPTAPASASSAAPSADESATESATTSTSEATDAPKEQTSGVTKEQSAGSQKEQTSETVKEESTAQSASE